MLKFLYNYQVVMSFSPEVSTHALMLRCQPAVNAMQHIDEEHLVMPPSFRMNRGIDAYGNRISCRVDSSRELQLQGHWR